MTEITRDSLQRRYADLVDAELLRRLHSGVLTELAQEVALAEAGARGLPLAPPAPAPGPGIPDDIDFAPDEFERNPYQAPRAAAQPAAAVSRRATRRTLLWDALWYVYVAVVALLIAARLIFSANPLDAAVLTETTTAGFAAAGIIAWRLHRAWLHPVVWITSIAVNLAWLAVNVRQTWTYLGAAESSDLFAMFAVGVTVAVAVKLPLFWGVMRYALFSPSIWRPRAPAESRAA